jgi:predicted nuclease of predicted toxin-antitoxin system
MGLDCLHVGEIGMGTATDAEILAYARDQDAIAVTLDADFHTILAVEARSRPSVIRIRIQGLTGNDVSHLLRLTLARYATQLATGCMITIKPRKTTCRLLVQPD